MGILEIHFHDSRFEWAGRSGGDSGQSGAQGAGRATTDGGSDQPSSASKLRSIGVLVLVVGGAFVFNKLKAKRARKAAEREAESRGRPSLAPWK